MPIGVVLAACDGVRRRMTACDVVLACRCLSVNIFLGPPVRVLLLLCKIWKMERDVKKRLSFLGLNNFVRILQCPVGQLALKT